MDDLLSLLLVFIFFILPILEQVFKKSRKQPPLQDPDETATGQEWEEVVVPSRMPAPARVESSDKGSEGGWADEWGKWPTAASEPEPAEVLSTYKPLQEPPPEEKPYLDPHPSRVDPHQARLEELAIRLNRMAEIEAGQAAAQAHSVQAMRYAPPPRLKVKPHRSVKLPLRSSSELRQAIILTEVLGPPLSTRVTDDRR